MDVSKLSGHPTNQEGDNVLCGNIGHKDKTIYRI